MIGRPVCSTWRTRAFAARTSWDEGPEGVSDEGIDAVDRGECGVRLDETHPAVEEAHAHLRVDNQLVQRGQLPGGEANLKERGRAGGPSGGEPMCGAVDAITLLSSKPCRRLSDARCPPVGWGGPRAAGE